jgi:phage I-like protein
MKTQNSKHGIAACTFEVVMTTQDQSDVRIQLFPYGQFTATDGRPDDVKSGHWLIDDIAFASIQANAVSRDNDFVIDYEHQTLYTDKTGTPAPASGWINPQSLELIPGKGLFASARWTKKAAEFIRNDEYKFISAVFSYDTITGRILKLLHAALTNTPALDGMNAVAALSQRAGQVASQFSTNNNPKETIMNEALRQFLISLGIEVPEGDVADAALTAHIDTANTAVVALRAKADKVEPLETSVAALKEKSQDVDLTKHVPKAAYDATVNELAALRAGNETDSVEQVIKDAEDGGKVMAAEKEYLTSFGNQQGSAALKQMLSDRPAVAALKQTQTAGKKPPESNEGTAALSADEKLVADQMGLSHKDFVAAKGDQ